MASLNSVFLVGNLTRDPEVRYTKGGRAVGDLRLAVNRKFRTGDGEDREETCFVSVVVWGRQAETCGEYLHKGSAALIEGRLQYEEWEKDEQKFNRLRVVANRVQFLGSPRGKSKSAEYSGGAPGSATDDDKDSYDGGKQDYGDTGNENAGDDDNVPF